MSVINSMLFRSDGDGAVGLLIWLSVIAVTLVLLEVYVWEPQALIQHNKDKALIDSLDCKTLGAWLINNSENRTDSKDYTDTNYHYAQAKYLVCTHGGLSP